jgi:hypothetical protein
MTPVKPNFNETGVQFIAKFYMERKDPVSAIA